MSDTAGDTLRKRFARSMLNWSPSLLSEFLGSLLRLLTQSIRLRLADRSSPYSHSDGLPMSK